MEHLSVSSAVYDQRVGNRLLDGQSKATIARFLERAHRVDLIHGDVIISDSHPLRSVYFPASGVYSYFAVNGDGARVDLFTVGREGLLGLPGVLGIRSAVFPIVARMDGVAYRVSIDDVCRLQDGDAAFSQCLRNYVAYALHVIGQNSLCHSSHHLGGRACRLLLSLHDLKGEQPLELTQEMLAEMLGVQRPSISVVAKDLQRRRIIDYRRGKLTVLDPEAMAREACECYETTRRRFQEIAALG